MDLDRLITVFEQTIGSFNEKEMKEIIRGLRLLPELPKRFEEFEGKLNKVEGAISEMVEDNENNIKKKIVHCPKCNEKFVIRIR